MFLVFQMFLIFVPFYSEGIAIIASPTPQEPLDRPGLPELPRDPPGIFQRLPRVVPESPQMTSGDAR